MSARRAFPFNTIRALLAAALLAMALLSVGPRASVRGRAASHVPPPQTSGDGLIAYAADDGRIYVMSPDGSGVYRLTDPGPGVVDRYPSFSPDGSQIAFVRDDGNLHSLCVVDAEGSSRARCLTDDPAGLGEPTWSPDGSRVAFLSGYDTTHGGQANLSSCFPEIFVIDLGTGVRSSVTRGLGGVDPAWSPDGTLIAFSSLRDDNYDIYTSDPQGSHHTRLTHSAWAEAEPAWSPDGSRIAYAARLLQAPFGCGFMPTGLADSFGPSHPVVYVMNADGSNQTELPATANGTDPTWSPDGARIALVVESKAGSQVHVTDAAGATLTRLTSDSTQKSSPSWSRPRGPR